MKTTASSCGSECSNCRAGQLSDNPSSVERFPLSLVSLSLRRSFSLPSPLARAFGVLEGIGLSSDPDYAIVGQCLPVRAVVVVVVLC